MIDFSYRKDPFEFKITKKQDGTINFSSEGQDFIYSEHYLYIGTEIASNYVYGIG